MKTFLLDIIPKIQRFSQKLDNLTVLTNKHWVVVDEELNKKVVFIFREKESQLLISENGKIEKGTWEYLGNNSLLIDRKDGSYLFKHGFIDDTVLALKIDGKEEYALLVNEQKFDNQLNSLTAILQFLDKTYSNEREQQVLTIPKTKIEITQLPKPTKAIKSSKPFSKVDYPRLVRDLETIKNSLRNINTNFAAEILISFCKHNSLAIKLTENNPAFTKLVVRKELPIEFIEELFLINKDNLDFILDLEKYLKAEINENHH